MNKTKQAVNSNTQPIETFIKQANTLKTHKAQGQLIFAIDATASRQATWDLACHLQSHMFEVAQTHGKLSLQLCYYYGNQHFASTDWTSQTKKIADIMSHVHCSAGATQIHRVLRHIKHMKQIHKKTLRCAVFIGDAVEEDPQDLADVAGELALLGCRLFIFQEGGNTLAKQVFQHLATLTGGIYARFDQQGANQLKSFLEAAAAYASGGNKALKAHIAYQPKAIKTCFLPITEARE